jgi:predicted Abi (CAAX) family protease
LQSRCIWMPMLIHWAIVVNWLLIWGGLEKIR